MSTAAHNRHSAPWLGRIGAAMAMAMVPALPACAQGGAPVTPASATIADGVPIPLWPGVAPGSENWSKPERQEQTPSGARLFNISRPTLMVFRPDAAKATGTALVFAAGGGFRNLPKPSADLVRHLTDAGITAVILTYRTMQDSPEEEAKRADMAGPPTPGLMRRINEDLAGPYMRAPRAIAAADGARAVIWVRTHAGELGVRPDRVGLMGNSSGGLLAATVAANGNKASRPDFVAIFYGAPPDRIPVDGNPPPAFIATASNDPLTWEGSANLYVDWRGAGGEAELHIYGRGQHGFREAGSTAMRWPQDLLAWMRMEHFLPAGDGNGN